MWSASSPEAWGASGVGRGVSWSTGGGPRTRRCAVAIWAVSVAARARSCSSARDAARSRSCEAVRAAWMAATTDGMVGSMESDVGAQVVSATSGRVVVAMAVTSADEVGGGAVASAHVVAAQAGNRVAAAAVAAQGERRRGGARGQRCRGSHQQRAREEGR
jgi:hypothetical protein